MSTCNHALIAARALFRRRMRCRRQPGPGTLNGVRQASILQQKHRAYRHKNYRTREFFVRFIALRVIVRIAAHSSIDSILEVAGRDRARSCRARPSI